jgi:hypothetical protein
MAQRLALGGFARWSSQSSRIPRFTSESGFNVWRTNTSGNNNVIKFPSIQTRQKHQQYPIHFTNHHITMTLYYSLVLYKQNKTSNTLGLCTSRVWNGIILPPHFPSPVHLASPNVPFHFYFSDRTVLTEFIWLKVAKIQYGLKITFIFILLLFIDSCNRVWRVTEDTSPGDAAAVRETYRSDMQARKFYAQRNMYLCGFTLFLSLYTPK